MSVLARYVLCFLTLTVAVAAFGLAGQAPARAEDTRMPAADPVWAASFKDLAGNLQPLAAYRGKVALIYFWATWCEPCQKEGPALQALQEKYKDKNFVVVGIAVDNADKVREFIKAKGMMFPIVYGGTDAIKLSKDMGNTLGGIPYVIIFDKEGRVVETITGDSKEGRIDSVVARLLTQ